VDGDHQARRCSPVERVERMFEKIKANLPGTQFILCVLPERKNCDIYGNVMPSSFYAVIYLFMHLNFYNYVEGPWKKKNLHEEGIVTQCIAPSPKMNDQYFTNVLKINAKVYISSLFQTILSNLLTDERVLILLAEMFSSSCCLARGDEL
jgi:eukaryotic translation initiation factor 2C